SGTKIEPPAPADEPAATTTPSRRTSAQRNGWCAELADHCHVFENSNGVEAIAPGGSRPDVGSRWQIVGGVGAADAESALGTSTTTSAARSAAKRLHLRSERSTDMGDLPFLRSEAGEVAADWPLRPVRRSLPQPRLGEAHPRRQDLSRHGWLHRPADHLRRRLGEGAPAVDARHAAAAVVPAVAHDLLDAAVELAVGIRERGRLEAVVVEVYAVVADLVPRVGRLQVLEVRMREGVACDLVPGGVEVAELRPAHVRRVAG